MVYHVLNGCWCIGRSERHYKEFIEALSDTKCGFPLLSFLHSDQVVSIFQINFGEELCSLDSVL